MVILLSPFAVLPLVFAISWDMDEKSGQVTAFVDALHADAFDLTRLKVVYAYLAAVILLTAFLLWREGHQARIDLAKHELDILKDFFKP